jgi:hypothetical protein
MPSTPAKIREFFPEFAETSESRTANRAAVSVLRVCDTANNSFAAALHTQE